MTGTLRFLIGITVALLAVFGVVPAVAASSTLSWSVTKSPLVNPPGVPPGVAVYPHARLVAVSCASRKFCVAVGAYDSSGDSTLTETWDGKRWQVTPGSGLTNAALFSVSCPTRTFCAAVGAHGISGFDPANPYPVAPTTLVQLFDGRRWKVVPSPSPAAFNLLDKVTCVSSSSCVAFGYTTAADGTHLQRLAESWNGRTWTLNPSLGFLADATCTSRTFCMAPSGNGIVHWNGTTWAAVPVPTDPRPYFYVSFAHVSCTTSTFCIAIEDLSGPTPGAESTLIVVWNGTAWTHANARPATLYLGTGCADSHYCFVVGGAGYFPTGTLAVLGRS